MGPFLISDRVHMWTLLVWGILRHVESNDGHCGYEFPWSMFRILPFGADATYHTYHHAKNVGNYSSIMTIWDTIFNTNVDYYQKYGKRKS